MAKYNAGEYLTFERLVEIRGIDTKTLAKKTKATYTQFIEEANRSVEASVVAVVKELPIAADTIAYEMARDLAYRYFDVYKSIHDHRDNAHVTAETDLIKQKTKELITILKAHPGENPRSKQIWVAGPRTSDLLPDPVERLNVYRKKLDLAPGGHLT